MASSLSVRPSLFRQVLQAQRADAKLANILRMPDVELSEDRSTPGYECARVGSHRADSGDEGKTVVRTVACESLVELSWLVWDAEDSLEFYPAQASQSFFSLPRSLRPWNRESSQQRQGARRAEETGR
ncbi:hypothetical protein Taro_001189 [Colocasia esculenta]|uniref:Uncharacterized protein n=1 Tax=Colocasia esculenta TaxID=4460 RepID=A0A843TDY3_COLES|nr:hypothetical protein [Colocasia esculenta]